MHMPPLGFRLFLPVTKSLEAELKHPLGLPLFSRDKPNDVFVQPFFDDFSMYVRGEAELVFLFGHLTDIFIFLFH